jgi:hypothetical protein
VETIGRLSTPIVGLLSKIGNLAVSRGGRLFAKEQFVTGVLLTLSGRLCKTNALSTASAASSRRPARSASGMARAAPLQRLVIEMSVWPCACFWILVSVVLCVALCASSDLWLFSVPCSRDFVSDRVVVDCDCMAATHSLSDSVAFALSKFSFCIPPCALCCWSPHENVREAAGTF